MKIIIDTREQHPFEFRPSKEIEGSVIRKLDIGDYSIEGYEDKIAIERKSPQDLFKSVGKDHKRFRREIERAKGLDYFAIIIEAPFSVIQTKSFNDSHYCQMLGDTVIQICYAFKFKYGCDVIFCQSRSEAISIIRNIFRAYLKHKRGESI